MIWVTGAKGMLGSDMVAMLRAAGWEVLGSDIEIDVRDPAALQRAIAGQAIEWVINCCAYTAVDKAETDEEAAFAINADGAAHVAAAAASCGARMIHISTDYVFDGCAEHPYTESDPVSPIGVYARAKLEGEQRVVAAAPEAFILRTAWLYGEHGANFADTMLRLMREREHLSVVADQHGSPTWTRTLCRVITEMLRQDVRGGGIYHVTSSGQATWHAFAEAIRDVALREGLLTRSCDVQPVTTAAYPTAARRPPYSVLACDKIAALLAIDLPDWRESVTTFIAQRAAQEA
jgi:dTDP-4-dehydrorhamnose reductase